MTPNGYADAPIGKRFVQPDEHQMTFEEFLKILMGENDQDIAYVQKQNSSFTDEFCELLPDTGKCVLSNTPLFRNVNICK